MTLGVTVNPRLAPPARGAPTDTDTAFVVGRMGSGSLTAPIEVHSLLDFQAAYGIRTDPGNQAMYDWLDTFFHEGGRRAIVGRYATAGTPDPALALFTKDLGPGQVAAPEEAPGSTAYGKLLDHAQQNNRFALLDYASGDTVSAMTTLAGTHRGKSNADYGMTAGQWVNVPGPAGVIGGSTRQVPGSAVTAALIARAEQLGNPNRAAAGRDFPLQYVVSYTRDVDDASRETLLNAGGNTYATKYGVLELYGFQSGQAASTDNPYWQANVGRVRMWVTAQALSIGERYMFRPIDGRGLLAGALKTDLEDMLLGLFNANGLFGETPADAFSVEVGPSVNTTALAAQGQLNAVIEMRPDLHAKTIVIELVTVPVTGNVTSVTQ